MFLDMPVSERLTVLQLKQLLFERWKSIAPLHCPCPKSRHYIRLRDGKALNVSSPSFACPTNTTISSTISATTINTHSSTSSIIAPILRDDRILIRCLPGLRIR
jgi:hypothetical protein